MAEDAAKEVMLARIWEVKGERHHLGSGGGGGGGVGIGWLNF